MKHTGLAALLLVAASAAAQVEVTSFHGNGVLTWTNSDAPAMCHVEWAANLTSGWSRSWSGLRDILMTNQTHSAAVPMFYRVVYEPDILYNGLVLYLPFDGNTEDLSASETDGVNSGATLTSDRSGNPTNAYFFDGSGAYVYVPDAPSLDVVDSITVSYWFRLDSFADSRPLVTKSGTNDLSFGGEVGSDHKFRFWVSTTGYPSGMSSCYSSSSIASNTWYHVVGSYQSGAGLKVYLNGEPENVAWTHGETVHNSSAPLRVGRTGHDSWYCHGVIDEVAIWNRRLSENEIKLLWLRAGRP
jgi:hypothetical protein